MHKKILVTIVSLLCAAADASWYWPFSSDDEGKPPRVAELMEPASIMIDEAYDLADGGKTAEAVAKYREALAELNRIEAENPDRVKEPEFNTLKNKRATVSAAIDSLLLAEASDNAKAIAVSDTTELQKKYDAKRGKTTSSPGVEEKPDTAKSDAAKPRAEADAKPKSKMEIAVSDLARGDFASVELVVKEILDMKPNDAAALNLRAAAELAKGDAKAAEKTLDQAIMSNPRSYYAYYNMARLMVRAKGNKSGARRYYDTGRTLGGPVDERLEGMLR